MRALRFRCLRCASVLEASAAQSGREARCPSCDAVFTVPAIDPQTGLAINHADPGDDGELPAPVHAYAAAGHAAPRLVRLPDDTLVIECPNCLRQADIRADGCPGCGRPFTLEGASQVARTSLGEQGHEALVVAILALPLSFCGGFGIVPGLLAVGLGLRRLFRARAGDGSTSQVVAVVLGLAACMISILLLSGMLRF